jgi:hypothetical protein
MIQQQVPGVQNGPTITTKTTFSEHKTAQKAFYLFALAFVIGCIIVSRATLPLRRRAQHIK